MRVCFSELNGKIQEKLIQNEKKTRRKTDEVTELLSSLLKIAHGHLNKKQNEAMQETQFNSWVGKIC